MANATRMVQLYGDNAVEKAASKMFDDGAELVLPINVGPKQPDNYVLWGPSTVQDIVNNEQRLLSEVGLKPKRRNTVRALVVSIAIFGMTNKAAETKVFTEALCWAWSYFAVPILSAVVRYDNNAPTLHILLLPIVKGKLNGSEIYKTTAGRLQYELYHNVVRPNTLISAPHYGDDVRSRSLQAFSVLEKNSGVRQCALMEVMRPNQEDLIILSGVKVHQGAF